MRDCVGEEGIGFQSFGVEAGMEGWCKWMRIMGVGEDNRIFWNILSYIAISLPVMMRITVHLQ